MNFLKNFFGLAIVIVFSFWAVKHLFIPGFFPIHDNTQVARVFEMGNALKDGMFPVRWVQDLGYGYGYPIFNFYAPLAYYIGGFFNLMGFDPLAATKIMTGLSIMLSGIFMYLLAREFWGELGGAISGLFYLYAPYHALDIYVRGDVAEFWAYAFLPLVFYGLWKVYREQKWKFVIISSLGYAGLILSHNLTAMMVTPFIVIILLMSFFYAVNKRKFSIFNFQFSIFVLGLLLSAFYWIPALFEMHYTNVFSQIGQGADFRNHFVCIQQLWDSPWGFGGSVSGCVDGLSFKIGKLHVIAVFFAICLVGLLLLFREKSKNLFPIKIVVLSILGFFLSVFFSLEISKPVWEAVSFMAFFQYPWRFLLLVSFFSSFLAGCFSWYLQKTLQKNSYVKTIQYIATAVLLFFLFYSNIRLFSPQTILSKPALDYTSNFALRWTMSKISDEYMPKDFLKPQSETEIVNNKIAVGNTGLKINGYKEKTQKITAYIDVSENTRFNIALAYFPGWKVFVDNNPSLLHITKKGFFVFLPKGKHEISIIFEQTPIEKIANTLSVIGVLVLIVGIIYTNKKRFSHNTYI